ncbi:recombinase family protein [Flavobacterium qiangtangense]|uniref:Recombinase family protein n=1 Tax=Flavobacterium qiangtangense TaxID=1442595 RepID=A0ABW1PSH8_9FLAO
MINLKQTLQHFKVLMYKRVSTEEQKENGYSLQEQEARIIKHCEKFEWKIIASYEDDHSAKTFLRPQWRLLLEEIKSKRIRPDIIVVTKIDRFSRDAFETHDMINILAKYNIRVFSISENQFYDFKDPKTFFQQYFSAGMAQFENLVRADNTKRGMRQASKEGRTMGKAPVGYLNDKINKSIIIDPIHGPLVVKGFEILSHGLLSIEEVRKNLIKEGLKRCCKQTFLNLVRNRYYYGLIIVPAWDDEPKQEVLGQHSPLISKELFDKVQMVHFGKRKKSTAVLTRKEELPLRGHLYCDRCGGKLTGSPSTSRNGTQHFYYHCQKGCKERFRADLANNSFENYLDSFKISKSVLMLSKAILEDVFNQDEHERINKIKQADDKIKELKLKLESLQDKLLDNVINKDDYHSIKSRIQESLDDWRFKKEELSVDKSAFQKYYNYGLTFLYNMKEYYRSADVEVKQKIIGSIFPEKIIFFKNSYRTTQVNELLSLVALNINELGKTKNGQTTISSSLPIMAPPLGLEPRTL